MTNYSAVKVATTFDKGFPLLLKSVSHIVNASNIGIKYDHNRAWSRALLYWLEGHYISTALVYTEVVKMSNICVNVGSIKCY